MSWDDIFRSRAWGRYPGEEIVRFVCRSKGKRALEIGCGPGANLSLLADRRIGFDAIDGSKTAVAQARQRLDAEYPGWAGRVTEGDFRALPDDFSGYDMALDCEALCCVGFADAQAVIRQIRARLAPWGVFWSKTFAAGTWEGAFGKCGPVRLTHRGEIERLYGNWESIEVGEITRHDGNPAQMVREWVIVATS